MRDSNIDERLLAEILAEHADALSRGEDETEAILARYPAEERTRLESLLKLSRMLRSSLVPVEPSATFLRDLGESLSQAALARGRDLARRTQQTILIAVAAIVGSLLSLIGLIALLTRRRKSVVGSH